MKKIIVNNTTPRQLEWTRIALNNELDSNEHHQIMVLPTPILSSNLIEFAPFMCQISSLREFSACLLPFDRLLNIAHVLYPNTSLATLVFLGVLTCDKNKPLMHIIASHSVNKCNIRGMALEIPNDSIEEDLLFYHRVCDNKKEDSKSTAFIKRMAIITDGLINEPDFLAIPINFHGFYSPSAGLVFLNGNSGSISSDGGKINPIIMNEYISWRRLLLKKQIEGQATEEVKKQANCTEFPNRKIHICAQGNRELDRSLEAIRSFLASTCMNDADWLERVAPYFDGSKLVQLKNIEISRTPASISWLSRIKRLFGNTNLIIPRCDVYIAAINFNCRGIFNFGNEGDLAQLRNIKETNNNVRRAVVWFGSSNPAIEGLIGESTRKIVLDAWPDLKDVLLFATNFGLNKDQEKALSILIFGTDQEYARLFN